MSIELPPQEQRACLSVDPELFFPVPTAEEILEVTPQHVLVHPKFAQAREKVEKERIKFLNEMVCGRCLGRQACLEYAIENPSLVGTWGGTTDEEREDIRRQRHEIKIAKSMARHPESSVQTITVGNIVYADIPQWRVS